MTFQQRPPIRQSMWQIVTVLVLLALPLSQSMHILRRFSDPDGNPLQQLVVHDITGDVYVGATNRLYRLSSDVTLLQNLVTGPEEDNRDCPPSPLPCPQPEHLRDGTTKGLVVDYNDDTLLVCSTLHHGSCQKVAVGNITHVVRVFHSPLVPDQQSVSCVLFPGPGPGDQQAVYVGAEYSSSGNEASTDLIPSISSRNLKNLNLIFRDKDGGTQKFIKDDLRSSFPVRYIYGFTFGDYAYFMTVQKENLTSEKLVTRISRVCTRDKYFQSYVEIPLHCEDSLKPYHVLQDAHLSESTRQVYAVFGESSETSWKVLKGSSVVCVVGMDAVDQEFNRTVQDCYSGSGRVGPPQYEDVRKCKKTNAEVDMCGGQRQVPGAYVSLEGQRSVVARAVWTSPDQRATTITVQASDYPVLAFVGTADGELVKVLIEGKTGQEVDRLRVNSGEPVVQIQSAPTKDHLYVLSPSEVNIVTTRHCGQRHTCEQCLADRDPVCGWCVESNRCTRQTECDSSALTSGWLAGTTRARCARRPRFQSPVLSYETVQSALAEHQITFQLEETSLHPFSGLDLACLFVIGGSKHRTLASLTHEVISCPLPEHHLPDITDDHQDTILRFHVHGKSIVTRSASASDCGTNFDCGSCTNSSRHCQWCFASGTCVRKSHSCSQISSNPKDPDPGITSPGACPLVWMSSRDKEILVHAGGTRRVAVQVRNLQGEQTEGIRCHFSYLGSRTTVEGTLSSQSLTCDSVKFDYPDKEELPYVTADFQVSWGPHSLPLDNSQGIQVRIYKCSLLVTNCGKCLSMDPEYECGWCGDRCTLQNNCPPSRWLDRTATCPAPQILRFSPTTGPIKGRATVSVTGLNLGKAYTDIIGGVKMAGVDCEVKPQHYEPSSEFVCETDMTEEVKRGTVVVVVDNQYTAVSDSNFSFVDPRVLSVMPKTGPRSGGTTVMIKGTHMDTGSDVSVTIGGGKCEVLKRSHTTLECTVPKQSGSDDQAEVKVNFGGHEQTSPEPFAYANDPIITMIEPKISILSGGTTITVIGMGLDLIQKPVFFVTYGGHFFTQPCHIENTLAMECPVPSLKGTVTSSGINVTESSPLELHYGFTLDGVTSLKNVSHEPNFGPLLLYPDPVLDSFPGEEQTKVFSDKDLLVVNGGFSTINKLMGSVSVEVGKEECIGVAATETTITCQPPSSIPDGTGKAPVWVRIGHMVKRVGYLRYYYTEGHNGEDKPLTLGIVLGVVIPILAIAILLTVCVLKRHRKHRPGTNYIPDVLQDYQDQPQAEEEMMGLTQITVVDVNGQAVNEEECGPYVADLLGQIEDSGQRQKVLVALIPHSTIHLGQLLGQGHFGTVYKAQLQGADGRPTQVAVKALPATNRDKASIQKFLQEMAELKTLHHPHLLPVSGVTVAANSDPLVVFPLMTTPDLQTYIRDSTKELTVLDLLGFGVQIADAMTYLQEVKVVHRNLATRNCIISEDQQIRLTDYGTTTWLFSTSHCTAEDGPGSTLLRWMAPESIDNAHFTSKSDVWSFGVVLWELLTRGITPYPDVETSSLLPYLKKGGRLPTPQQSPPSVSELMSGCWSATPDQRPDFPHLHQQLALHTTATSNAASMDLLHQPVKATT